jgi:hypothetical protein
MARPDHRGRRQWIVGGIVVLVVLAIVLGPVLAKDASRNSEPPSPSTTTTVASTRSAAIHQWAEGNIDFLSSIYDEVNTFATAANKCASESNTACGDSIGGACASLRATAQSAQHGPAVPGSAAERDWQSALAAYVQGAQECMAGTNQGDSALVEQAIKELTAARADFLKLLELAGLTGSTSG